MGLFSAVTKGEAAMPRRFLILVGASVAALTTLVAVAGAGSNTILTFADNGATVTQPDATSAYIVVGAGQDGGVYQDKFNSQKLSKVKLAFVSSGDVQGGAPRWSVPIDTNKDSKTTEGFAFMDAAGCGATVGVNPAHVPTLVSTASPTCAVNFQSVDYANWAAFAAANPDFKTSKADVTFVIADVPGNYFISGVKFK
jgi:hypothetical protein